MDDYHSCPSQGKNSKRVSLYADSDSFENVACLREVFSPPSLIDRNFGGATITVSVRGENLSYFVK